MYIYIYTYTLYTYTYIYIYKYIFVYTYTCIHKYAKIYIFIYLKGAATTSIDFNHRTCPDSKRRGVNFKMLFENPKTTAMWR